MWALGKVTFQMLTGKASFEYSWQLIEYCQEKRGLPLEKLTLSIEINGRDFISSLMEADPSRRITTIQGLNHRWMQFQYTDFTRSIESLDLGQGDLLRAVSGEVVLNHSLDWTNLSAQISGPIARHVDWRSGQAANLERLEIEQTQPGQHNNNTVLQHASAIVEESMVLPETLFKTLKGHSNSVRAVAFSPDGKTLASASWDKTVRLWDGRTGAALKTLEDHRDLVNVVAFSPDGKMLASASDDKTIRLWE